MNANYGTVDKICDWAPGTTPTLPCVVHETPEGGQGVTKIVFEPRPPAPTDIVTPLLYCIWLVMIVMIMGCSVDRIKAWLRKRLH